MTKAAAFSASYTDWKLIRTRSVVQIVFEMPIEKSREAYDALGGMPMPAAEVWCGIARLQPAKEVIEKPRPPTASATHTGGAHRSFHEMPYAQQAGILCTETTFHRFLTETIGDGFAVLNELDATILVHDHCKVSSRKYIVPGSKAETKWNELVSDYRAWMREPAVVPA